MTSAYEKPDFWECYHHLYWCCASKYRDVARGIAEKLRLSNDHQFTCDKSIAKKPPLNVLVLGVGLGTIEIPLLAALQRETNRDVKMVGLDSSKFVYESLIRLATYELDEIGSKNPKEAWALFSKPKSGHSVSWGEFQKCDIDYAAHDSFRKYHTCGELYCEPSRWYEDPLLFTDVQKKETRKFDLVIASFCLMHLDWWQHTLTHALHLLDKDGLFLHMEMGGDEILFEKGQKSSCEESGSAKNLLWNFFAHPSVERTTSNDEIQLYRRRINNFAETPRTASASRPLKIYSYLRHFSIFSESIAKDNVTIENSVSAQQVFNLLRCAGYSTFREIRDMLGESNYAKYIYELEHNGKDSIFKFELKVVYFKKTPSDTSCLPSYKLHLLTLAQKPSPASIIAYDLTEASKNYGLVARSLLLQESCQFGDSMFALANAIAKQFLTTLLPSESTIGGEVAILGRESKPVYYIWLNPLYAGEVNVSAFYKSLQRYLSSGRSSVRNEADDNSTMKYSNFRYLMTQVIPKARKDCLFRYRIKRQSDISSCSIEVKIEEQLEFLSVIFDVYLSDVAISSPCLNLGESEMSNNSLHTFVAAVEGAERVAMEETNASKYRVIAEEMIFKLKERYGTHFADLVATLSDKRGINSKMVETILNMNLIELGWREFVFYPASYYVKDQLQADDAVSVFYDKELSQEVLAAEYLKITRMLGTIGLKEWIPRMGTGVNKIDDLVERYCRLTDEFEKGAEDGEGTWLCLHDAFNKASVRSAFEKAFGFKPSCNNENLSESFKALFLHVNGRRSGDTRAVNPQFIESFVRQALGISISIDVGSNVRLGVPMPCQPALPFWLALLKFTSSLREGVSGEIKVYVSTDNKCRMEISLQNSGSDNSTLAERFYQGWGNDDYDGQHTTTKALVDLTGANLPSNVYYPKKYQEVFSRKSCTVVGCYFQKQGISEKVILTW